VNVRSIAVALVLLLAVGPVESQVHAASSRISAALPVGAHITSQMPIPGYAHETAVEYSRVGGTTVAVVTTSSKQPTIVWQHTLLSGTWSLDAPGPRGLFRGLDTTATTKRIFAFIFTGSDVTSAIAGSSSGMLSADIKASLGSRGLTVVTVDGAHQGNVAYKWNSHYTWSGTDYTVAATRHFPNYAPGMAPKPNITVGTADGSQSLISIKIAKDDAERETGLMYITSLDPDDGMLFVWPNSTSTDGFWMENTYVPLSIAFVDTSGKIIDIQDMAALDTTVHYAPGPYRYAIEVNQGYFAEHDIKVGDAIKIHPHQ
jgi:uncharacterized membrane protein (UPF0127 family)